MDEKYILNTINQHIKQDINMHTCRRLVVTVPLFKGFPIMLINTIIFALKQEVFIPDQEVIKRGHRIDKMYFIYYGTVAFTDELGNEVQYLNDGAHFGEEALLRPNEPATTTVTALEISEIYTLSNAEFTACVELYPHIQERLSENQRRSLGRIFPGRRQTNS
ncbi:potassium/sodium hyperpolarization-activated cyclic nucleotide-gated channel 1-like [Leguminivora glycinivorella]|uniref:potassium/sodium hyperpolarization-activated cyclic nucleotide-gated channel 1-like n=1 Tax=Leguminivora glycinivorella TaxID=1035111 RepID=UPI00200DF80F|nr:potassium/sodium hyperpolarization-activated cyclic nucleotide-gated channel 1-like [Leguminivora glycinivorella]